jgi:replication factor A1
VWCAAAKVGDYNGKTLSSLGSSVLLVDPPDIAEAAELRAWYDGGGAAVKATALSQAGRGGKADRRATVGMIKDEV